MKPQRAPHEAIVVASSGPAYQGRAGQTRTERVHLVELNGAVRSVEVYRVVNVGTDPDLKPRVMAGQLHRIDPGRELALPFVYHDPNTRKFALVIPPALAHLEVKEWARLMTEVAEDTNHPVPSYVRDGTTVLGLGALELFLEAGVEPDDAELQEVKNAPAASRASDVAAREKELAERDRAQSERAKENADQERTLMRMAQDLAAQEAALARREQQLATARADLDARENELKEQRGRPRPRESEAKAEGAWREPRAAEPAVVATEATVVADVSGVIADASVHVTDGEIEAVLGPGARSLRSPPPLKRRPQSVPLVEGRQAPPPLRARTQSAQFAQVSASLPPPLPQAGERSTARQSESPPPPAARVRESERPPLPGARGRESERPPRLRRSELAQPVSRPASAPPPPALAAPPGFAALAPLAIALHQDKGELTLCVKLDPNRRDAFDEEAELLVQLAEPAGYPVLIFALAGAQGQIARTAVDALSQEARGLLERLERVFRASVALFVGTELHASRPILAPREANARAILERLARLSAPPGADPAKAVAKALAEPPPVRDDRLPFGPPRPQPATTASVLDSLQKLEVWTQPDKLDQALVLYGVPKHVIDASCRRVLRAAIGFGIALPQRLAELAVQHKLAESRAQLVREQLEAFRQRIERKQNDLDVKAALVNWERLFAQADELDMEVPRELRQWVERTAAETGAPPPDLPLSSAELRRDLGDPGRRLDAIRELGRRGHPSAVGPIIHMLEELSPEEVASAVVTLLWFHEAAADGLMDALSAPSQHVRHASALGLGQLKLARCLPALIRRIEAEPTPSWSEMARALGDYGPPALLSVAEALKVSDRRERLMLGLAHLANHGASEDVKRLESDPDSSLALAARQALVRRARMEAEDIAVRTQQPLRDNSPEARFSQAFFAELARTAS